MNCRVLLVVAFAVALLSRSLCEQSTPAAMGPEINFKELETELLAIFDADQEGRSQIEAVRKVHGFNSPEMRALWQSISAADAINLVKVKAILDTYGWIGPTEIGPQANSTLFLVIQHADLATQEKYLPLMRTAVLEKKALPSQLALLEDRVALAEGRRQIYGSQLFSDPTDGNRYHVSPMEDPDHVDDRRAAVGLDSMAMNLRRFNLRWDVEAYKKDLPELERREWGGPPNPGGYDKALQTQLLAVSADTQKNSQQLAEAEQKHGRNSPEFLTLQKTTDQHNAANLAQVKALIDQHGWISLAQVGKQASSALILVFLQAADLVTQKQYLPMMRAAVKANQADASVFAMIEDHIAFEEGRRQTYGSQIVFLEKTATLYVAPLDDPDHVDERRAELGLQPLAEYAKTQNVYWDVDAYKQQLPAIEAAIAESRAYRNRGAGNSRGQTDEGNSSDAQASADLLPSVLTTLVVTAHRTTLEKPRFGMPKLPLHFGLGGWPVMDGNFVLTPERGPQLAKNAIYTTRVREQKELTPPLVQIETVEFAPQFGRTRNASSRTGSEGQRVLVLLDGVQANDPIDGTVRRSELPAASLARVETLPGGGATAWGSPAGVIQLFTLRAEPKISAAPPAEGDAPENARKSRLQPLSNVTMPDRQVLHGTGSLVADIGDFGTRELEFFHGEPMRGGMLQVLGRVSATDGFMATLPEWRGAADTAEWERHRWLEVRWRQPLGTQVEVTATIQGSEETRGLGTAYQREGTRAQFASIAFAGQTASQFMWNGVAYVGNRASSRTFSAVDSSRTSETPLIDEFAEPARQLGVSWTGVWNHTADARTNIGIDFRTVRGETRSLVDFSNDVFAREIVTGAEQTTAGAFVIHHRRLTQALRGMVGVRLDRFDETDGHLRETDRISGALLRDLREANLSKNELSPSAGLVWNPSNRWRLRAAAQKSFAAPTLAERYRVTGERNRLVEPNTQLKTEHSTTAEVSAEYTLAKTFTMDARLFAIQRHDASVTRLLVVGAGDSPVFAPVGPIEHRERINLDRARIGGAELSVTYRWRKTLAIEAMLLLQNSRICDADELPTLVGHQIPGVPKRVATTTVRWQTTDRFSMHGRVRWLGREYVNEENSRRIGEAIVADCGASYALTVQTELFLQINNLGDARVETSREATGVTYASAPRIALAGVRVAW